MPVYFLFPGPDRTLTLWGQSVVETVNNSFDRYSLISFKPFKPLAADRWVKGLTGEAVTGRPWRQGQYRYLDERHEQFLSALIEGGPARPIIAPRSEVTTVILRADIREKLERIAEDEGREVEDLIKEAIARIIRDRGV